MHRFPVKGTLLSFFFLFYAFFGFGQLSGNYTIDKSGLGSRNYTSFAKASADLKTQGISGAVKFTIASGIYHERIILGDVKGTGPLSRVTFDGLNQDSVVVTYTATSQADASTLELDSCDYFSIKNITFRSISKSFAQTVRLSNGSNFNEIVNCRIEGNNSSNDKSCGIILSGKDGTSIGSHAKGNRFESNLISGHYSGISLIGKSNSWGNLFQNEFYYNTIDKYYSFGVFAYQADSSVFHKNVFQNPKSSNAIGYYESHCNATLFSANEILGYGKSGVKLVSANSAHQKKVSDFINNMISGESKFSSRTQASAGFDIRPGSRNIHIWHNSVRHKSLKHTKNSKASISLSAAIRCHGAYAIDLRNNILSNRSTATTAFSFVDSASTYAEVDFNNYDVPVSGVLAYDGMRFGSISLWRKVRPNWNLYSRVQRPHFKGKYDLHLSNKYPFPRGTILDIGPDLDEDSRCNLAPTIGADESEYGKSAFSTSFAVDDTVYINTQVEVLNASSLVFQEDHLWYINGQFISKSSNLTHEFKTYGRQLITLISESCEGKDSFKKYVWVDSVTAKPSVEFIADKNTISILETVHFTDLSGEGASLHYWKMEPYWVFDPVRSINMRAYEFVNGTDSSSKNPEVVFLSPSTYNVCLRVENDKGASRLCKSDYIVVGDRVSLCEGKSQSNAISGKLFDPGGAYNNYKGANSCSFSINSCAEDITLVFKYLSLASNDFLRIYEGKDSTGKTLSNYHSKYINGLTGQSTVGHFRDTIKVKGGDVFIEFEHSGASGLGFELEWFGKKAIGAPPIVGISAPDTICTHVIFHPKNISFGAKNRYFWSMGEKNSIDFLDSSISYQYKAPGNYWIKLKAENCFGYDEDSQSVTVVSPIQSPKPTFVQDLHRPKVGQGVRFTDLSSVGSFGCANEWTWSFSPSTVVFTKGTDRNSQNPVVQFGNTGCYSLKLVVGNTFGKDSITVSCVVDVLDLCHPKVAFLNSDIGISRVVLEDIDRSSKMANRAYNDYTATDRTQLELGKSYDLLIGRSGSRLNDINRSVWIDFNQDGSFNDSTERVIASGPDKLPMSVHTITVPTTARKGWATMRVGVNISNKKNDPCGPNQFGEYEDYLVEIVPDQDAPVIYMVFGNDTAHGDTSITLEKCSNWSDPVVYGWDEVDDSLGVFSKSGNVNTSKVGKYLVRYEVKDFTGNVAKASITINVLPDSTAPTLVLNEPVFDTLNVYDGFIDPGYSFSDNCTGTPIMVVKSELDSTKLGTYTIEYQLKDSIGNITQAKRYVTVVDKQVPVPVSLKGDDTTYIQVFDKYDDPGALFTDNYDQPEHLKIVVLGFLDTRVLGQYVLSYTAFDRSQNRSISLKRIVIVHDTIVPEVNLLGLKEVDIGVLDNYYDLGVDFSDNYSSKKNITVQKLGSFFDAFGKEGVVDQLGQFEYTYKVQDEAGNSSEVTRLINVDDRIAPEIQLNGALIVEVPRWADFVDPGYEITDNYWVGDSVSVEVTSNLDMQSTGAYYTQYCPIDASGNRGICVSRTILVVDGLTNTNMEMGSSKLAIYPNPTDGMVVLESEMPHSQEYQIVLMNTIGQQPIVTISGHGRAIRETIDCTGLPKGVYLVKLETDMGVTVNTLQVGH